MEELLKGLNKQQKEAVLYTEGPLIVFAGAGSGKTRVLTRRAAYLVSECKVDPSSILAITFTNKAADEMKDRIRSLIGEQANDMWISTFHSMCARILRAHATNIGYDNRFTIYDTDDCKSLIKKIVKRLGYPKKEWNEKSIQCRISSLKNDGISANDFEPILGYDKLFAKIYSEYEEEMFMSNCLDFDDLLMKTDELLDQCPDILYDYQDKFRYVMVDEYQDTNKIQFKLVKKLADGYGNVCVVGDDDQSIYKFRGANVKNILRFGADFPSVKKILLEQNYRSTKTILNAANSVIANNTKRAEKRLWTDNPVGEKIKYYELADAKEEADRIISDIKSGKYEYSDIAILYRSNRQSRLLEEACLAYEVPYQIIGGISFYQRKEIKDMTAYLKVIENPSDSVSVKRIINVPKRGIGDTTVSKVEAYADSNKLTLFQALLDVDRITGISAKAKKSIHGFIDFITLNQKEMEAAKIIGSGSPEPNIHVVSRYMESILGSLGYVEELEKSCEPEEFENKHGNLLEFIEKIISIENGSKPLKLTELLESIALVSEAKGSEGGKVSMLTMHSSKGLEFKKVYIVGMTVGMFPTFNVAYSHSDDAMEEERRLCYVAITRAMESLTLSSTKFFTIKGELVRSERSPFLEEIPKELLDCKK